MMETMKFDDNEISAITVALREYASLMTKEEMPANADFYANLADKTSRYLIVKGVWKGES